MARSETDEMFEEFYNTIKESKNIDDVCQEWGGISITVPAFVGERRNRKIWEAYLAMDPNAKEIRKLTDLARQFSLSTRRVRDVIKRYRGEVGLFDSDKTTQE